MKVFVWTGGHTIAESLFQNPPQGVEVVSNIHSHERRTGESGERMYIMPTEAKQVLDSFVYNAGLPRFLPSLPDVDIIHTVSGLVPIVPKPWVTSISMPSSFFGLKDDWCESRWRLWVLRKILSSDNCRCVTCFSESTMNGLKQILLTSQNDALASKFEVLYPAVDRTRFVSRSKTEDHRFRILFVGNHFFDKGGRELHRAVSRLAGKYDLRLDIVTDAPPHHKLALREYMRNHKEDWARWYVPGLTRKQLIEEFYPAADVFAMPSYMEVFGFVFIEAMASGLPVIGANVYAQREIISDGENGYLIDIPISPFEGSPQLRTPRSVDSYRKSILNEALFDKVVDQLTDRLRTLMDDSRTLARMANASLRMTIDGKFSVKSRNKRLKEIYDEAVG